MLNMPDARTPDHKVNSRDANLDIANKENYGLMIIITVANTSKDDNC